MAPATGTRTGSVTFYDGTTAIGTATLVNGKTTFVITTLARGSDSIKAVYSGDGSYLTSASNVVSQQVN